MKYYEDTHQNYLPGTQPFKVATRKNSGKGKKLHSFIKDDVENEGGKFRGSYKRTENKSFMRNQLRDMQMAF
jgi:hypothetical protein